MANYRIACVQNPLLSKYNKIVIIKNQGGFCGEGVGVTSWKGASAHRLISEAKNHFSMFLSPAKTFTEHPVIDKNALCTLWILSQSMFLMSLNYLSINQAGRHIWTHHDSFLTVFCGVQWFELNFLWREMLRSLAPAVEMLFLEDFLRSDEELMSTQSRESSGF